MIDHHVDRPGVEARQRAQLTGPNRPIGSICVPRVTREQTPCMEIIPRELPRGAHDQRAHNQTQHTRKHTRTETTLTHTERVDWTTWWPWRGAYTRSHPELGREIPQRPWYCVLRHGRVGRRQVFQSTHAFPVLPGDRDVLPPRRAGHHHHRRGVEQPGSSSGS